MYISELSIKNYRKFQEYKISFSHNMSVLIGKNGTGKTSILEALTIAMGSFFYGIEGMYSVGINPSDAHNKYYLVGEDIDVQKQFPVEITAKGKVGERDITWTRKLNSIKGRTTSINAKEMTQLSLEYQKRLMNGDSTLILPMLAYYGTGRLWDDHREKWSIKYRENIKANTRANGYIDCLDGRANVKLLMDWFRRMSIKSANNGKVNGTYMVVKKAMENCFSRFTGAQDVSVLVNPDTSKLEICYHTEEDGGVQIPLDQLSDGYRCALSLIGDIAYRMATLNPQLGRDVLNNTPGIVLIDEVDLHLHPEWQQLILKDLTETFPRIQFIVTTHAPAIINSAESSTLLALEENTVVYLGNDAYGRDVNTIVKTYMGSSVRPIKIQNRFNELYGCLDSNDMDGAKKVLNELREQIDVNDAELASCIVKIKLAERKNNR